MLRLVKQRHDMGCIPACIATLTGRTYSESLRLFSPRKNWNITGVTYARLKAVLKKIGIVAKIVNHIPNDRPAILLINHPIYEGWHAVIWDHERQKVLDPFPSKKRRLKRHLSYDEYIKNIEYIINLSY